jgi:hypothetical protein
LIGKFTRPFILGIEQAPSGACFVSSVICPWRRAVSRMNLHVRTNKGAFAVKGMCVIFWVNHDRIPDLLVTKALKSKK